MKVIFCIHKNWSTWGSTYLRAIEVSKKLNDFGINSEVVRDSEIVNVKKSLVILVKYYNESILSLLKRNGNRVVYDVIDNINGMKNLSQKQGLVDGIIFPNSQAERDFSKTFKSLKFKQCIEHHWDTRLNQFEFEDKNLKLGYFGNKGRSFFPEKFNQITVNICPRKWNDMLPYFSTMTNFNCHYIVGSTDSSRKYTPFTKGAIAAACNSIVLVYKDNDSLKLLGSDYPYYVEEKTIKSVNSTIERLFWTYKKDQWYKAMDAMKRLKYKTDLNILIQKYITLAKSLS